MSSEWTEVSLEDVALLNGGYAFKSEEYTQSGHFVLRTINIADDGTITKNGATYVSPESAIKYERFGLKNLDTLYVMVGATLGKTGLVKSRDLPALLNQNMWVIRAKKDLINPLFLYYAFKMRSQDLSSLVSGSARGFVKRDDFRRMKISLPDADTQQQIASFLGSMDDRITLLRETNATLEAIAQALFKSWFVDFDPVHAKMEGRAPEGMDEATAALFPDSFEESELGLVPSGWRVENVGSIADVIDCLHAKKPDLLEKGRPFLQLSNIRDDGLLDIGKQTFVSEQDYQKWISRIEVSGGDCVITNVGRVGAVSQIPTGYKAAMGRNMTAIRLKPDYFYPTYLIELLLSPWMKVEIDSKTDVGTILNALNVKSIPTLRCIFAEVEVMKAFEELCRPLRASMEKNLELSQTLAALRDTLLPRLISGQLRLPS